MNWIVFTITAYVLFALQAGLAPAWAFGNATPNLLLILAVFVGVSAARHATPWALLILGVLLDLQPGPLAEHGVILGPHALGYLVGAYAVLQLRNLLFRESLLTIVIMVFAVGGFAALIEAVVYALRGLPWMFAEPLPWSAGELLWRRFQQLLYTAVVAIPLGALLQLTRRAWGFNRGRKERVF